MHTDPATTGYTDDAVDTLHRVYGHITPALPRLTTQQALRTYRGGYSLDEIAQELGVCGERVRQIEEAALKKLRNWCEKRGLQPDDLMR